MILTFPQIKDIVLNNPNKVLVSKAREYSKDLRTHIIGGDLLEAKINTVDGFEKEALKKLRAKYTKSNKDLFSRLSRPIDKVFSARGGSSYYNLSEEKERKAVALSGNIRDGYSAKKWIEMFWKPHFLDDPNGMLFVEIGKDGVSYPTYKNIASVYDYLPKGVQLEYVAFIATDKEKAAEGFKKEDKIYRVIDDAFDYWVRVEGETVIVLQNQTYTNYSGRVPAIINSDIASPSVEGLFLSLFDDIIELADNFLLKGSIKVTHDFLHGFPKYWQYVPPCKKCEGHGTVAGDKCVECNGSGRYAMNKVSDALLLPIPESDSDPVIAPNLGGYIQPSKDYYDIATAEISDLENVMNYTIWGTDGRKTVAQPGVNQDDKTATQVIDEIQPKSDRLMVVSEMAEKRIKFILDLMIPWELIMPAYPGASINLGRRYLLESPDELFNRYSKAKKDNVSPLILNDMYLDYIETLYSTDRMKLERTKKLFLVEPFFHYTIDQVKGFNVGEEDYKMKLYFAEWLASIPEGELVYSTADELKVKLKEFASVKQVIKEVEPTLN